VKVLCVEPGPGGGRAVGDLMAREGHEVAYAAPARALQLVRTRRVDVVVLPRGEGDADSSLLGQVRRLEPRLPVIVVGDEDTALAAAEAVGAGALGYVAKAGDALSPPMGRVLSDLVKRAAARARFETDREASLRETLGLRKFYADVLGSVQQGIVVIDHDGRIRFRNPAAARILGEDEGEGPLDGQAAPQLMQLLVETMTSGDAQSQTIAYEAEEQRVFLDVTASVLRDAQGKSTGAVAAVADRSAEKHLEQQLVHTERLATLGSLLASIAHEINNTLTSVTGCAEMGLELAGSAEEAAAKASPGPAQEALSQLGAEIRQIFDMVLEAGVSAQTIADNMLQYSRQGKPSHQVQENVNALIQRTVGLLGKHLGVEKVELTMELDPAGPQALIQPAKLQQALVNLIVNAVHALLDVPLERRKLRLETHAGKTEVTISVIDQGPGIPPNRLARIFQPFFTTKGHGTGLGLYITRRVVEDLDGRIEVDSEVGAGTTFRLLLPRAVRRSLLDVVGPDSDPSATRVE
jgi:PAS domain S-box-containing protein